MADQGDTLTPPAPEVRKRRVSFALVGQVGAVLGVVATALGIFVTARALLSDDENAAPPSATIEIADVNDRATAREYMLADGLPTGDVAPAVLRRLGVLTTVRYTSTGLEGKQLPLLVSLASRETGEVVCEHEYELRAGEDAPPTFRAWSPFPARGKAGDTFNLHVTLMRPDRKPPHYAAVDRNGIPGPGRTQPGGRVPLDVC